MVSGFLQYFAAHYGDRSLSDAHAKYTFVSRHHPIGNTDYPDFQDIDNVVRMSGHKYTLYLTGHTHEYKREFADPRAFRMGIGGAPFDGSGSYYGYATVMQCPDDHLYVTVYDQATNTAKDTFSVPPQ